DFPIKPIDYIYNYFSNNSHIYMNYFSIPRVDGRWGADGGLGRYLLNRKQLPPTIKTLFGGSQWWSLPHHAILLIINYITKNPEYLQFYKDTYIPDESFFQTILLNHKQHLSKITNNNLRLIDWDSGP